MKRVMTLALGVVLSGSLAIAADAENKDAATVDTSKNPITGTVTTTKKYEKKAKNKKGKESVEVTEKTKQKTDGTVTKSVDVEADAEASGHH